MAPKPSDSWIKTLLDSLQQLYTKLSALILNQRMNSHRKDKGAPLDDRLLSTLYDIVEKIPGAENSQEAAAKPASFMQDDSPRSDVPDGGRQTRQSDTQPARMHADLSNHLHTSLSKASDSGHLGEKLKESAWDHIHTSLRHARDGKKDLAKMYADLAKEALQQVSHHLSDEEYTQLKTAVLEELQKQQR